MQAGLGMTLLLIDRPFRKQRARENSACSWLWAKPASSPLLCQVCLFVCLLNHLASASVLTTRKKPECVSVVCVCACTCILSLSPAFLWAGGNKGINSSSPLTSSLSPLTLKPTPGIFVLCSQSQVRRLIDMDFSRSHRD